MGAAQGNGVPLEVSVVDVKKAEPSPVFDRDDRHRSETWPTPF
jgi:hypothetical protein